LYEIEGTKEPYSCVRETKEAEKRNVKQPLRVN